MTAEVATAEAFRDGMARLASGVVLVTNRLDGRPWGMTVSSCCSVSVDPPSLLVSLEERTASARAIEAAGRFGVNVLGANLLPVAAAGAAAGAPKFIEDCPASGADSADAPRVAGALAWFACEVIDVHRVADHALVVGLVRAARVEDGEALVYWSRRFHGLTGLVSA